MRRLPTGAMILVLTAVMGGSSPLPQESKDDDARPNTTARVRPDRIESLHNRASSE